MISAFLRVTLVSSCQHDGGLPTYFPLSAMTRLIRSALPLPGGPVTVMNVPIRLHQPKAFHYVRERPTRILPQPTENLLLRLLTLRPSILPHPLLLLLIISEHRRGVHPTDTLLPRRIGKRESGIRRQQRPQLLDDRVSLDIPVAVHLCTDKERPDRVEECVGEGTDEECGDGNDDPGVTAYPRPDGVDFDRTFVE
jgi:hypothetical protein